MSGGESVGELVPILNQVAERLRVQGNYGPGWSDVADATAVTQAAEALQALDAGVRKAISECEACGGSGFDVIDDGHGDIDKDPCQFCWDLRELIHDTTNYTLKPLEEAAAAEPFSREVRAPRAHCAKSEYCFLHDGHEGACDEIPF